jgi:hypothetical protein
VGKLNHCPFAALNSPVRANPGTRRRTR